MRLMSRKLARAFDDDAAVAAPSGVRVAEAGHRCREIADEFFDDVFQGQQAEDLAVFVDDEADALAVFLEESQLRKYGGSGGNVIGGCNC
jgi:hypothetical protein